MVVSISLRSVRERLAAYWDKYWRVPAEMQGHVWNLLVAYATIALFFLWLGLSGFGLEGKAINALGAFLPPWFLFANLLFAPLLLALTAGPLLQRGVLRLVLAVPMLCSLSLFVVTRQHQLAGLAMLGFLYLEAFWIIPQWNKWSDRRSGLKNAFGRPEPGLADVNRSEESGTVSKRRLRSRPLDLFSYIGIAIVLVVILLVYIFQHSEPGPSRLPDLRWLGLAIETVLVFGYYLRTRRSERQKAPFWMAYIGLLGAHLAGSIVLLSKVEHFPFPTTGFVVIALFEWVVVGTILFMVRRISRNPHHGGKRT
jgi:hypothetical protein